MWGAPGTMLAALFLHERKGDARWAQLFRATAQKLRSQLLWSDEHGCQTGRRTCTAPQHLPRRRPRLRRHRVAADPRPSSARRGRLARLGGHDREHDPATATSEHALANWRAWLDAERRRAGIADAVLPRRAGLRRLPRATCPVDALDELLLGAGEGDVGRRAAAQGLQPVPRHGGQRLRVPEAARAHRRRALARARARVRNARDRPDPRRRPRASAGRAIRCGPATSGVAIYLWTASARRRASRRSTCSREPSRARVGIGVQVFRPLPGFGGRQTPR